MLAPLEELAELVARLGTDCLWTQAQSTADVVRHTQAELLEVEQAVSAEGAKDAGDSEELTDELGDVLFNALLLIEVARRERPQLSLDASAAAAVRKIRRRAPYLFGGPPASSIAEAEAAWQAAKAAERDGRTRRSPPPTMRLRGDGRVTRRAVATAAAAAVAAALGRPWRALALPPPCGATEPLVPLLQCRVLLAELVALVLGGGTIDWRGAQRVLRGPPFAEVPTAVARYQASLSYGGAASLSAADRQLCFPRSDAACAALLVGADRDFRNLLRDGCLNSLHEVDAELEYLARCQEAGTTATAAAAATATATAAAAATATAAPIADAPTIRLADGVLCGPEALADTTEVRTLLLQAGASFDGLFDSVPAGELERAMEAVRRREPRREIVKLG